MAYTPRKKKEKKKENKRRKRKKKSTPRKIENGSIGFSLHEMAKLTGFQTVHKLYPVNHPLAVQWEIVIEGIMFWFWCQLDQKLRR